MRTRQTLDARGLIALWGTVADFARATDIPDATIRSWTYRGLIPPEYWDNLIDSAHRLGIKGVSLDSLMASYRIGLAGRAEDKARQVATAARLAAERRMKSMKQAQPFRPPR